MDDPRPTADLAALQDALHGLTLQAAQAAFPIEGDAAEARWMLKRLHKLGFEVRAAARPAVGEEGLDVLKLVSFTRHRSWCPEFKGPGDCTCGLYALLESILCTCGHTVRHHTNRDVSDVVGWPCLDCKSARCRGFALAAKPSPEP